MESIIRCISTDILFHSHHFLLTHVTGVAMIFPGGECTTSSFIKTSYALFQSSPSLTWSCTSYTATTFLCDLRGCTSPVQPHLAAPIPTNMPRKFFFVVQGAPPGPPGYAYDTHWSQSQVASLPEICEKCLKLSKLK